MADKPRHNWLAVRTAYIVLGMTAQQCADEFGIHVVTIKKRAIKEGWTEERKRNTTQGSAVVAEQVREEMQAVAASQLRSHAVRANRALDISDALATRIEAAVATLADNDLRGLRSVTETYHRFAEALAKGFGSDRLVRGIKDGLASDIESDTSAKRKPRRFVLVTPEEVEAEQRREAESA